MEDIEIVNLHCCCTVCYIQMNEYYHQGKMLAVFLKWPHKGAFVVLVTLIKFQDMNFLDVEI